MSQGVIAAVGEEALMGNAPLRRLGGDEDLKGAALLFASDAGQHITGQASGAMRRALSARRVISWLRDAEAKLGRQRWRAALC